MLNIRNLMVFVAAFGFSLVSGVFAAETAMPVTTPTEQVMPAADAAKEVKAPEEKNAAVEKKEVKKDKKAKKGCGCKNKGCGCKNAKNTESDTMTTDAPVPATSETQSYSK